MFIPTVEIMTFPFMCHMPTQNLWLCFTLTCCLRVTRGQCHCYLSDSINMMCTMINIQSNLYIKGTQGILKMYSLWAVAFIYRLKKAWRYKWGNELIRIYNTMDKNKNNTKEHSIIYSTLHRRSRNTNPTENQKGKQLLLHMSHPSLKITIYN